VSACFAWWAVLAAALAKPVGSISHNAIGGKELITSVVPARDCWLSRPQCKFSHFNNFGRGVFRLGFTRKPTPTETCNRNCTTLTNPV